MPATFRDVYSLVKLHVPDAPIMLVRAWVQQAYAMATDDRAWSWTLQPTQLVWQNAVTLDAVTVTMGSRTVTSAALFDATMRGRQFRSGTYPIYTVAEVVSTSEITLDMAYQGTPPDGEDSSTGNTGSVAAQIIDAYVTMPEAFGAFMALVDPVNQRWVPWWMTMEELDLLDPTRTAADTTPRVLAGLTLSQQAATEGRVMYQYWPIPTEAGSLQGFMRIRPEFLSEDSTFKGVLAHRTDVLRTGALMQAAQWPGTVERKNPYFNLGLAAKLEDQFSQMLNQLDLRDDDQYQQSISRVPWERWSSWQWATSTHYLQMTDATIGAYQGMGYYPSWSF